MERAKVVNVITALAELLVEQEDEILYHKTDAVDANKPEDEMGDRLEEVERARDEAWAKSDQLQKELDDYRASISVTNRELGEARVVIRKYEDNIDPKVPIYSHVLRLAYEYMILEGKSARTHDGKFNKIAAIKQVRVLTGWGLRDSKNFVEGFVEDDVVTPPGTTIPYGCNTQPPLGSTNDFWVVYNEAQIEVPGDVPGTKGRTWFVGTHEACEKFTEEAGGCFILELGYEVVRDNVAIHRGTEEDCRLFSQNVTGCTVRQIPKDWYEVVRTNDCNKNEVWWRGTKAACEKCAENMMGVVIRPAEEYSPTGIKW